MTAKDGNAYELRNGIPLGSMQYDQWLNISMTVYFSAYPGEGRLTVAMNGEPIGTVTGRTLKNLSDPIYFYLNFYGGPSYPYGTIDYDNIEIRTGDMPPTPTTPVPSSPASPSRTGNTVWTNLTDNQTLSGFDVVWTAHTTGATAIQVDFLIDSIHLWTEHYALFQFNGDNPQGYLDTTALSNGW